MTLLIDVHIYLSGSLALPVGIVLGMVFLMLMGVALFIFLYRRK